MKLLDIYKNFKNEQERGQGQASPPVPPVAGVDLVDLDIEPMTECIHGKPCSELYARPGDRPGCFVNMERVFDMGRCPLNKWVRHF
jgi:hypothetical protein